MGRTKKIVKAEFTSTPGLRQQTPKPTLANESDIAQAERIQKGIRLNKDALLLFIGGLG